MKRSIYILSFIAGLALAASAISVYHTKGVIPEGYSSIEEYLLTSTQESLNVGSTQPAGLFTYRLSGSGVSSSATSFTLNSLTLPQNDYPIQDSDLSDTFHITLEPGNTSRQEFVSCTTVGANSGGSVTISGCTRGISPITPYTASSTLQFAHPGGSAVIFSNSPSLFEDYTAKANTEHITGSWGFQGTAPTSTTCATTNELCNKTYVDSVTNQGAATSTEDNGGIVELGTALESASSTGAVADALVMQTRNATDTPQAGCATGFSGTAGAGCAVIASLTGTLKQAWLDLTEAFTWTGNHTFDSNVDIEADAAAPLVLNTISYVFPSIEGASSTVLSTDGSGNLSWDERQPKVLHADTTQYASSAGASTTVFTFKVDGGSLKGDKQLGELEIIAFADKGGSGNDGSVSMYFGDGTSTTSLASLGAIAVGDGGRMDAHILTKGSQSKQVFTSETYHYQLSNFTETNIGTMSFDTSNDTYIAFEVSGDGVDSVFFQGITITQF